MQSTENLSNAVLNLDKYYSKIDRDLATANQRTSDRQICRLFFWKASKDFLIFLYIPKEKTSSSPQDAYKKGKYIETVLCMKLYIQPIWTSRELSILLTRIGSSNHSNSLVFYLIRAILNNRAIQSKLGSWVIAQHVSRRTQQAGVLCPLLYNILINLRAYNVVYLWHMQTIWWSLGSTINLNILFDLKRAVDIMSILPKLKWSSSIYCHEGSLWIHKL